MNWVSIISQKDIKRFKLGILNAHCGDLPRYRGNACPNWAIINGEKDVTVSIHFMEDGRLDCGRVISQAKMPIKEDTYIGDIYKWAEKKIPELFLTSLSILQEDPGYTLKYADPDAAESLRCYPRRPEDGRINWRDSAESIHRLIRASGFPFCGAFAFLEDEKIFILRAEPYKDGEKYYALPGQVCESGKDHFVVITGSGKLKVTGWKCRKKINSIRQRLE
jgi:UDP-4-amino-4-deoxy-L-arabinose formyltransferase/UDP-glucuronic acid dehydrogenase (UDP-4-keto-hexauronic acid decarboxylating)